MNQFDNVDFVRSKEDFIRFVEAHANELKQHPGTWSNKTLPDFFDAMAAWVEDMDGYYVNKGLPVPDNINWTVFADVLSAANMHE